MEKSSVKHSPEKNKTAWKESINGSKNAAESNSSSNSTSFDEEDDTQNEKIIQSLTSQYNDCEGGDGEELLGKTIEYLRENLKAGICLICIENVERTEAIWSCRNCYCILHLVCIQRWAKDSIANVKEKAAQKGFNLPLIYCCPKCRGEYHGESEYPDRYKCFCGKVVNPRADPWSAPHSCGETCGKPLQPECGHSCKLLCHSGPCPPCPIQVTITCFCGQATPKTLRCFTKSWSCNKVCSKELPCTIHTCTVSCHNGPCPPCEVPTTLNCKCSSPTPIIMSCSKLSAVDEYGDPICSISCGKVCNNLLDCGIQTHKCTRICHEDPCGTCERTCPCGKARAPCAGEYGEGIGKPCGDTCEKILDCGSHSCFNKCHNGECGSCKIWILKKCRCEQYEKEVLCSKEFVCTTKCKRLRDCKVHVCGKKCCPGDCSGMDCRIICGKTLACKTHRCESICHSGSCYPCPVTAQVKCKCGQTIRQVPCGSEKKCKPPDCHLPCSRPTKCDHSKIQNHHCHFGDCPKCRIPCGKINACKLHLCDMICHTVKTKQESNSKPCPKCMQLVRSKCSLHSDIKVSCHAVDDRCKELCRKILKCNEHLCGKPCHIKIDCGECTEPCNKPRPNCQHLCDLGCHLGPCPPCTLVAKLMCHCKTEEMFIQCSKQLKLSEAERSCKNQCPNRLKCGHRCLLVCHSQECPELEKCRRKVKLTCKCKHLKKDIECFYIGETKVLDCVPGICNIPKTPKESGGQRKRSRKKKTSESESLKGDEMDETNNLLDSKLTGEKKKMSFFSSNLKAIGIIAVSALITASALRFYTDYFGSDS